MTEAELERAVRDLLKLHRLFGYHTHDSRRSTRGFPDFVIVGRRGVLWRELKSADGRLTSEQRQVGYLLQAAGQDWSTWRPVDLRSGRIVCELVALKRV